LETAEKRLPRCGAGYSVRDEESRDEIRSQQEMRKLGKHIHKRKKNIQ
jgi:hypothetical protein